MWSGLGSLPPHIILFSCSDMFHRTEKEGKLAISDTCFPNYHWSDWPHGHMTHCIIWLSTVFEWKGHYYELLDNLPKLTLPQAHPPGHSCHIYKINTYMFLCHRNSIIFLVPHYSINKNWVLYQTKKFLYSKRNHQ